MPSLDDIVGIAESLQRQPLLIDSERCVAVRHRQAKCRRCVDACSMDALTVSAGEISVRASLCVGCGACAVACPTEALVIPQSSEEHVLDSLSRQVAQGAVPTIACARACAHAHIDEGKVVEVPCLARIDECMLVHSAAAGAPEVRLIDGNCATCKYGVCMDNVVATIDSALMLIEAQGAQLQIEYASEIPESCLANVEEGTGATRRGFLTEAVSAARGASTNVARAAIGKEVGADLPGNAVRYGKHFDNDHNMPTFDMPRHEALLNALFELGEGAQVEVNSPSFGNVSIESYLCNGCGVCCVFCPTDALRRDESKKPYNPRFIEFSASDCVKCGLCTDTCWKRACRTHDAVELAQVFDFEPRVFNLGRGKSTNPAV